MKLKEHRELARLTQFELAQRAKTSQAHISALEAGRLANPTMNTVEALAHALDVSIPEIISAIRESNEAA